MKTKPSPWGHGYHKGYEKASEDSFTNTFAAFIVGVCLHKLCSFLSEKLRVEK